MEFTLLNLIHNPLIFCLCIRGDKNMQQNEYKELQGVYQTLGNILRTSKVNISSTGFKIRVTDPATNKTKILPSIRETARYIHCSEGNLRYWFKQVSKVKKKGYYLEKIADDQYQLP